MARRCRNGTSPSAEPIDEFPCTLDRQVEIRKRVRANDLVRRIVDANACVYHLERGSDRGNDRTDADPQT